MSAFQTIGPLEAITTSIRSSCVPPGVLPILAIVGLDCLGDGAPVFISDAADDLLWATSSAIGLATEWSSLTGRDPLSLPWDSKTITARARAADAESPVTLVTDLPCRTGTIAITSRHWVAFGTGGDVQGIASSVVTTPIIERLRNETLAARERLDDLTRLVSDWLWETDAQFSISFISNRATESLGLHRQQLLGRSVVDLGQFVDGDGVEIPAPLDRLHPLPFRDLAFVIQDAGGSDRNLRLSGVPVFEQASGKFCGFRGTARDVTVETTALGMLRSSRRQLNQAIEAVSDGFALFDADERLLLCNRRFLELMPRFGSRVQLGMSHNEIVRGAFELGDLKPDQIARRIATGSLTDLARSKVAYEFELADGRWIRATDRITSEGTIVGIRAEITDSKLRERALTDAKLAAENANRSKSEFLANISHELRTPLNAIIGFSEMMVSETLGPLPNDEYRSYIKDVYRSGQHLLEIINDIIDLSRADAGDLELTEEPMEIDRTVEVVRRMLQEKALRGQLQLDTKIEPGLPILWADQRKIRQILVALTANAVKFNVPGGRVTIEASREPLSGDLCFRVIDTGIGIAPEHLAKILQPFGQVQGALNREYEGVGLGLPLAKALTQLHEGRLSIASRAGEGTTVEVRLPARRLGTDPDGASPAPTT